MIAADVENAIAGFEEHQLKQKSRKIG